MATIKSDKMELDSKALFEGVQAEMHGGATVQILIREKKGRVLADFRIAPPENTRWTAEDGIGALEEVWASKVFADRLAADRWLASEPLEEVERQQARAVTVP